MDAERFLPFSTGRPMEMAGFAMPFRRFGFRDGSPLRGLSLADDAAHVLRGGSALRAGVLSFASPKESSQRKGDPRVGAGFAGSLRYSNPAGAAELGATPLRQSSPSFRRFLRCSAPLMGTPKTSRNDGSAQEKSKSMLFSGRPLETAKNHLHRFGSDAFRAPLRGAEQRRTAGGIRLASV